MKDNTIVTHAGNRPFENQGIINPPVYHASTVLSPTFDALLDKANARRSLDTGKTARRIGLAGISQVVERTGTAGQDDVQPAIGVHIH